ncbi:MAG: hypothetical protein DMF44_01380 [Verrucomicrobia bacterium]|nr:MAG: hypothetical protein DMF44_01380 [Verrucomicrobiota bacterium]
MDTNRHEDGGPEKPRIAQITRICERTPRRPCLKAWPSLRVNCSGLVAETIFFTTQHTKIF